MRATTRERILDYLRKQQTASVRELSRAMVMTGANIRHHLAVLESNGLIEVVRQYREGRGRPVNVYGLSRRVLGDGFEQLAGATLKVWLNNAPVEVREAGLKALAVKLVGTTKLDLEILLPRRLTRAVELLNELHYQARWEAGADGPHIILGYCPYSAIIAEHPELCRMDAFLLEQRTGLPVDQTVKLQTGAKGYPFCIFRITGNK
jgi:predicted ArsR family transcriptional regulator